MQAWIPIWILGAPFVAVLVLSALFKGGSSAAARMDNAAYSR